MSAFGSPEIDSFDTGEDIKTTQQTADDALADIRHEVELDPTRERVLGLCQNVIAEIVRWAGINELTVQSIEPLGLVCQNPVLLISTDQGVFVAKGFASTEESSKMIEAQRMINTFALQDVAKIPVLLDWAGDNVAIYQRAKGVCVRKTIEEAIFDPEKIDAAENALYLLGMTLSGIHKKSLCKRGEDPKRDTEATVSVNKDIDLILSNLYLMRERGLLDLSNKDYSFSDMKDFTEVRDQEEYSLIHADAHLDNFFVRNRAGGNAAMTVIDYEGIRFGDPCVDLSRALASLRAWCKYYHADDAFEQKLTSSLISGYRSNEIDTIPNGETTLYNYKKILIYELRMYLTMILHLGNKEIHASVCKKLGRDTLEANEQKEIFVKIGRGEITQQDMESKGLSEKEMVVAVHTGNAYIEVEKILDYLFSKEQGQDS